MSKENRHIPYGESWTCTGGDCCTDEQCERWTFIVSIVFVLAFITVGVLAVIDLFV